MSGYTPGQWCVVAGKDGTRVDIDETGQPIALVYDYNIANARLIEQAPAMAEALEGLLWLIEDMDMMIRFTHDTPELVQARAALEGVKCE